jgi:hypothetical protein
MNNAEAPFCQSLIDSFQPCPGYSGELFFFTLAESAAASMIDMAADLAWEMPAKLAFAAAAIRALAELHVPSAPDSQAVIHRALTPESVRVRADGFQTGRPKGLQGLCGSRNAKCNPFR